MELWVGALNLGFLYAFMTMGVFFTFRIHDFPDITVDGSFTSGAAAVAVLIAAGVNPFLALGASFLIGAAAGSATALINTRFNINGLLAGILVMTGLYSINLHIMGRSNIPLLNQVTFLSYLEKVNPRLPLEVFTFLTLCIVMALFWFIIALFLKTDLGIAMRITGNNPVMAAASGVNVNTMKIFGVALANGLVGVSGGLVAQYQGFADIGMGIGTIVIGLAAVIIGESILKTRSIYIKVFSVILGSVIFRFMIAGALYVGMNPIDLKLLTALFVLITLVASKVFAAKKIVKPGFLKRAAGIFTIRILLYGLVGILVAAAIALFVSQRFSSTLFAPAKVWKIGVVQFAMEPNVELCKQGILKALTENGYEDRKNIEITYKNAQADFSIINSIIQDFIRRKVDIIVPLSTPCVQSAVQFARGREETKVVFTYIYDPYKIGAATSPTDHLPNMTGISCFPPVEKILDLIREMFPGRKNIGIVWNSSESNSEAVLIKVREHAANTGLKIIEATAASPAEVLEASRSLAAKGAQVFLNGGDNTLNVSFSSFTKVAREHNIPVFSVDSELIEQGACVALGPDYYQTGYEGGRYLAQVLRGKDPKDLPIYQTRATLFYLNMDVAKRDGLSVAETIVKRANKVIDSSKRPSPRAQRTGKRLALFLFSDNYLLRECAKGVTDKLERSGTLRSHNITVDMKNAQNEFSLAQSVAQDIVRQQYDYIITISTPALQVMANANKKIPHIFGAVTDPYRVGVAKNSRNHLPHLTGVATLQPVATTIKVMRELFPKAKRIGIVWNPSEACSEACTYKAREAARKYNFELVEITVSSTGEVLDAVQTAISKKVDLFLTSGDNTVITALQSVAGVLKRHCIPYFTNTPMDVELGSLVSIGADYAEVGKATALMAERVINGENPKNIPINDYVPEKMYVNRALAKEYGISLPDAFLKRATWVKR